MEKLSVIRQEIELNKWIVISNHFHAIAIINNSVNANGYLKLIF